MSASLSGNGNGCRIHMLFQNWLLTSVHPQMSGIGCCLPSKPVVGDLAESQVHMVASFLPCWSCQSHILLSAAEWLKIPLTILQGCGPEPQHLIVMLSKPFKSWVKKEQSEISLSPAAHIIERFLQPNPNRALETLVDLRSQKIFSTGESAILLYNPSGLMQKETRQMRRNMWEIAREWRHKNWPKEESSKFPSNTASSKWNTSWKKVEHRIGELRVYACWGKG